MATWTGNGPNSKTFVYNIKTGERSWQVDLNTQNHSEIKEMQQKLTNFGYSTQGADGTYGNNTKTAVINFQRAFPACGTPDGYFGKNTLNTFVSKVGSLAGYTGSGSGGSGGGTGSGSSDDFTDNVTTNPTVTTHYTFYAANAVAYAKVHSSNVNTDASDNTRIYHRHERITNCLCSIPIPNLSFAVDKRHLCFHLCLIEEQVP